MQRIEFFCFSTTSLSLCGQLISSYQWRHFIIYINIIRNHLVGFLQYDFYLFSSLKDLIKIFPHNIFGLLHVLSDHIQFIRFGGIVYFNFVSQYFGEIILKSKWCCGCNLFIGELYPKSILHILQTSKTDSQFDLTPAHEQIGVLIVSQNLEGISLMVEWTLSPTFSDLDPWRWITLLMMDLTMPL